MGKGFMSESVQWLLIVAGLCVSGILILFIIRQLRLLRSARQDRDAREARHSRQRLHLVESIQVLARTMLEDQVELSEGCIRIKVLLDNLAPELNEDPRFQIFQKMYESMEHMPTHEARQQTDKRFVRKLDHQRFRLERENQQAIRDAARALLALDWATLGARRDYA